MSTVTFDKMAYLDTALHDSVVTQSGLQAELQPIRTDIAVLKWMLGFNPAATMGVIMPLLRHG